MGNLFAIMGRMNSGVSLVGRKKIINLMLKLCSSPSNGN